jgi:acetyl esterase/lipase
VPIGYLVTAAFASWCTLCALAPPRRTLLLSVLDFISGFVLNELPFVAYAWIVASTVLASDQSGLNSLARIVLGSLLVRRRTVKRVRNIRYGPAGRKNLLDVYRRRSGPSTGPVLIHLHGGALFMGRKSRESLPLIYRLADQDHGWVCVSANYRLRPAAAFPDHLIDVKKVIAWVREHAHEYGADPPLVFIAGSSSGAQLAALAALTANDPKYQPGFEHADTSVSAAICLHGYYGSSGAPDQARFEPLAYAGRQETVPFFVAHGDQDSSLPAEPARLFAERLRAGSTEPVVYAQLPGAQHGFDRYRSLRFERVVDAIEDFSAWVRVTHEGIDMVRNASGRGTA